MGKLQKVYLDKDKVQRKKVKIKKITRDFSVVNAQSDEPSQISTRVRDLTGLALLCNLLNEKR